MYIFVTASELESYYLYNCHNYTEIESSRTCYYGFNLFHVNCQSNGKKEVQKSIYSYHAFLC